MDNPGGNGRLLTVVYYLNANWRVCDHGGSLQLWAADYSAPLASIAPLLDRAVLFWSDLRVPHEVLPSTRLRMATQVWFHSNEAATPQDDAEYAASLHGLAAALRRRAHVQVRTLDDALSSALERLRREHSSAEGTMGVRALEDATVAGACFAWLERLGALAGASPATASTAPATASTAPATAIAHELLLLQSDGVAWHALPEGAQSVVIVQLGGASTPGGGASAHCRSDDLAGWPAPEDAPVPLEPTPGEGAVFLHVFRQSPHTGEGRLRVHLRLRGVPVLALCTRRERASHEGAEAAGGACRRAAAIVVPPPAMPVACTDPPSPPQQPRRPASPLARGHVHGGRPEGLVEAIQAEGLVETIQAAAALSTHAERELRDEIGEVLLEQSQHLDASSSARATQMATAAYEARLRALCSEALRRRDQALREAIASAPNVPAALSCAARLGLVPHALAAAAADAAADAASVEGSLWDLRTELEHTRHSRQHELGQRLVRELLAELQRAGILGEHGGMLRPASLALPAARQVLGAADVARLRAGEALVIDPPLDCLADDCMRAVHTDLARLIGTAATPSHAPCNTGSLSVNLPLPRPPRPSEASYGAETRGGRTEGGRTPGDTPCDPSPDGGTDCGLGLGPATRDVMRLMAALPLEIERHGWPRRLGVPPVLQLASYTAATGARYTPHLDRWPHEAHNQRELTILLYANCDWDARRHGGCLRLLPKAPAAGASAAAEPSETIDVSPVAGRIVIFPSAVMLHEVLPVTGGAERLALTLWVEHL